jgi:hypothetical protein
MSTVKNLLLIVARSIVESLGSRVEPTRKWAKAVWDGDDVSFQLIDSLDIDTLRIEVHTRVTNLENSRELVQAVMSEDSVASRWLMDAAGEPITNIQSGLWWLEHTVVWPLIHEYLFAVQEFRFDDAVFGSMIDQFSRRLDQIQGTSTKLYPLLNANLTCTETLILPGVKIRRVDLPEYDRWANPGWFLSERPVPFSVLQGIQCLVETSYQRDGQTDQIGDVSESGDEVVTAIRLLTGKRVFVAFTEEKIPLGYAMRPHFGLRGLLRLESPLELDDTLVSSLKELVQLLASSPNAGQLRVALRRWDTAYDRLRDEDRLIDYWIALESLFTPDSNQELLFRASLRIAAYLGNDTRQRRQIYDDIKTSYGFRSSIVHGNAVGLAKLEKKVGRTLREITDATGQHLREAILAVLKELQQFDPGAIEQQLLG